MDAVQRIIVLPDSQLVDAVTALAASERRAIGLLIAGLAEFDARKLYVPLGYSSMFAYCTRALHLSEQAAYARIEAARAARRFPIILERIMEGSLSLTATRLLSPHLTASNHSDLVARASRQRTRVVEQLVAEMRPRPPVPAVIRRLPQPLVPEAPPIAAPLLSTESVSSSQTAADATETKAHAVPQSLPSRLTPSRRPVIEPLSPTCYRLQVTLSADAHAKLREAQTLSRHWLPNGDPAAIVERGLDALLVQLRRAKFAEASKPRELCTRLPRGRHIPAGVKRKVWERDGGRCAFVTSTGRRCEATEFIEYHHVTPYARGGAASAENIELRCRAHNAHEAELEFGPRLNSSRDE